MAGHCQVRAPYALQRGVPRTLTARIGHLSRGTDWGPGTESFRTLGITSDIPKIGSNKTFNPPSIFNQPILLNSQDGRPGSGLEAKGLNGRSGDTVPECALAAHPDILALASLIGTRCLRRGNDNPFGCKNTLPDFPFGQGLVPLSSDNPSTLPHGACSHYSSVAAIKQFGWGPCGVPPPCRLIGFTLGWQSMLSLRVDSPGNPSPCLTWDSAFGSGVVGV